MLLQLKPYSFSFQTLGRTSMSPNPGTPPILVFSSSGLRVIGMCWYYPGHYTHSKLSLNKFNPNM